MLVIADATPPNVLVQAGLIHVLPELFGRVTIPRAVAAELSAPASPDIVREWLRSQPEWLEVRAPARVLEAKRRGQGEREAISLALELQADLLLVDDHAARRTARELGLTITGTVGVLRMSAQRRLIDLRLSLDSVRKAGLFVSDSIIERTLREFEED